MSALGRLREAIRRRRTPAALSDQEYVQDAMRRYIAEHPEDEYAARSYPLDAVRFAKSIEWIRPILGPDRRILELGGRGIASHILEKRFELEVTSTVVDLRDALPYTSESFDVVVAMEVLEHICDVKYSHATVFSGMLHCLKEAARVLRIGGQLFITTPNACSLAVIDRVFRHEPPWFYPYHFRELTPVELRFLVESAGLHVTQLRTEYVWWEPHHADVRQILEAASISTANRGDDIFVVAQRRQAPPELSVRLQLPV